MAKAGNCDSETAPTSQNQDAPRIDNRTSRRCHAWRKIPAVAAIGFQLTRRPGDGAGAIGTRRLAAKPTAAQHEQQDAARGGAPGDGDREPAGDRAGEDREKGAGLHQGIAVDQLGRREMLRQQRVFDRARKRRLRPEHEQQSQRERQVAGQQGGRGAQHGDQLGGLEDLQQPRALEPVGQLPRRRREQKERRDQRAAGYRRRPRPGRTRLAAP